MPNRLAGESSPYLLQHKDNPVDWLPWGDEAFDRAHQEGKPVFLSVGYSSCHWCHVMAHESFEDAEVGALLNRDFISVKVDREERPDVDEAYMAAVQLSSGRGGWPMSVFLTPSRQPFFAGTYYPKEDRGGYPGFKTVLSKVAEAWKTRRSELETQADEFAAAIRETLQAKSPESSGMASDELLHQAVRIAAAEFDPEHGGAKDAPKFPPHSQIEFLLAYALWDRANPDLRDAAVGMALRTLQAMCLGGIHDHVGGGFHRYSTDEKWLLPHFEKMLYDNALMLGNLAQGAAIAGQLDQGLHDLFVQAVEGILGFLGESMTSAEGLFHSALDADSEGEEGKFYVWTVGEVESALGPEAPSFLSAYGFSPEGNFEGEATRQRTGANIPHLQEPVGRRHDEALARLRNVRTKRPAPALDHKALVGWNGLAIRALAQVGALEVAERAAEAILGAEHEYGELPHQVVDGKPSGSAYLEDYAAFGLALTSVSALHAILAEEGAESSVASERWAKEARRIAEDMVLKFWDETSGGFFATNERHESLFGRAKPVFDTPIPSANALAIRFLVNVGDDSRAKTALDALRGWMERAPNVTEALHLALMELDQGELEAELLEVVESSPVTGPGVGVTVSLSASHLIADDNGIGRGVVRIDVPAGLHLNSSEPPARWLTPTRIASQPIELVAAYPAESNDRYEGAIEIPFTIQLPAGESGADVEIEVCYQACTEQECLLPERRTFGVVVARS